jgi:hypothetical protein
VKRSVAPAATVRSFGVVRTRGVQRVVVSPYTGQARNASPRSTQSNVQPASSSLSGAAAELRAVAADDGPRSGSGSEVGIAAAVRRADGSPSSGRAEQPTQTRIEAATASWFNAARVPSACPGVEV